MTSLKRSSILGLALGCYFGSSDGAGHGQSYLLGQLGLGHGFLLLPFLSLDDRATLLRGGFSFRPTRGEACPL